MSASVSYSLPGPAPPAGRFVPVRAALPPLCVLRLQWEAVTAVRFAQPPAATVWSTLGAVLYETDAPLYHAVMKPWGALGGVPGPLVVAAAGRAGHTVPAGERFEAEVLLVGRAGLSARRMADAAQQVTALGAGRSRGAGNVSLCEATWAPVLLDEAPAGGALSLRFETPVALKRGGVIVEPDGPLLIRRLAWRVRELSRLYTSGPDPDFRSLVGAAEALESHFDGHFEAGRHYSARQSAAAGRPVEVPTGGYVGRLSLRGPSDLLAALRPLLALGTRLGAGKNAERGFGRYSFADPS